MKMSPALADHGKTICSEILGEKKKNGLVIHRSLTQGKSKRER